MATNKQIIKDAITTDSVSHGLLSPYQANFCSRLLKLHRSSRRSDMSHGRKNLAKLTKSGLDTGCCVPRLRTPLMG